LSAPLRLSVHAPDGCTNRDAFFAAILARTGRIREAQDHEPARFFRVEIAPAADGGVVGSMIVREPAGQEGRRDLVGADCGSVATGLALAAALIMNRSAAVAATEPPLQRGPPVAAFEPPMVPPPRSPSSSPSESPEALRRSTPMARLAAGAAIEVATGPLPNPAVMPGIFVHLEMPGVLKRLSARVSLGRAFNQSVNTSLGTGNFALTGARVEPCFNVTPEVNAFHLDACGVVGVVYVGASGTNTNDPQSVARSWAELGVAARPTLILARRIALGFAGGVAVPTARPHFYFAPSTPDTIVYQVASRNVFAEATVGAYFW
jgi:hypothetical protein